MDNPMLAELDEVVRLVGASERELVTHPDLSAKAVNFIRTHHATLADMAKRLEVAARDAARYRFIRDKQATIIYKRKGHGVWEPLIDTREMSTRCASLDEAVDAAIDATQEGEGDGT